MTSYLGQLRKFIFGISSGEATFARRGFYTADLRVRDHLEAVGKTFLQGYHAALEQDQPEMLGRWLNATDLELRGFAFEGAAMGLGLLDLVTPWRKDRLQGFLNGPGASHIYMAHVGAGWALARLRRKVEPALKRLDPFLCWLAVDGYGFHEGYFHWKRYVKRQEVPKRLCGYARRVFDQGLGRSLWFVEGADVTRIPNTIAVFASSRRADLWSGIGLACAYAGGADRPSVEALRAAAGLYRPHLAQGAAFAAKARERAGNPAPHTDLACEVFCGLSAKEAAHITDAALVRLPSEGTEPSYEVWRKRIREQFALQEVGT